jgi:hypothetical protein
MIDRTWPARPQKGDPQKRPGHESMPEQSATFLFDGEPLNCGEPMLCPKCGCEIPMELLACAKCLEAK